MVSRYSPPVLYLTDDDDEDNNNHHRQRTDFDGHNSYQTSYAHSSMDYRNAAGKKRTLPDGNVRVNPSVVNWTKRPRNDHYQSQIVRQDPIARQSEIFSYDQRSYNPIDDESHSFHAFDWSNDTHTSTRVYSNPISSTAQMSISQPTNVMNVIKQHLNHLDSPPSYSQSHKTHRYHQHSLQKNINFPITSTARSSSPSATAQSPLPLPLPTPTSSFNRSHPQRIHPEKNLRMSYSHSNPPSQIHHPIKTVYQPLRPLLPHPVVARRSSSPVATSAPVLTSEIRRQALNGTGTLTAFYDSKCYRCNICKFKTSNSPALLQHLFTHIFYCTQCAFYSYSHHDLYQHISDKHPNHVTDIPDPKALELLYVTRCSDGKFALCMDTTPTYSPQPPAIISPVPPAIISPVPPPAATKTNAKNKFEVNNVPPKRKITRRRPRQKDTAPKEPVVPPEKPDETTQSSISIVSFPSVVKEKPTHVYVLMKHRRCYTISKARCLHPLVLEYSICREHTIRHMCHTHGLAKRRKLKPKINLKRSIVEVASCLKSIVNQIVSEEDNQNSTDLICLLPNHVLNRIYSDEDLESVTSALKLTNKYTKSMEQKHQYRSESSIRTSNQHIFILSSSSNNKVEPSVFGTLQSSITIGDSPHVQTKLQTLPISCDNTHRFLKGHLNSTSRPATMQSTDSNHSDSIPRCMSRPLIDKDNSSSTSPKSKPSSSPCVIILD